MRSFAKLLIKNLPKGVTQAEVQQLLQDFGPVNSLKLHTHKKPPNVLAAVHFASAAERDSASASLDGLEFRGRTLTAEAAPEAASKAAPQESASGLVYDKPKLKPRVLTNPNKFSMVHSGLLVENEYSVNYL